MIQEPYIKQGLCKPDHMITYKGKLVNLMDFKPEDVDIEVIAHGLAQTARWNGQGNKFCSVVHHSILMARRANDNLTSLQCLLHDAEEAYWGDIIRPIKHRLPKEVTDAMDHTKAVIFDVFGVPMYGKEVKLLDDEMLQWEWDNCIHGIVGIELYDFETMKGLFLQQFYSSLERYKKQTA